MALRKPLVLNGGQIEQLQSGDTLDGTTQLNDIVSLTNGETSNTMSKGQAVYISDADTVKLALADASATARVLGLVNADSIASSASGEIITDGILSNTDWTNVIGATTLTAGAIYYLDNATAGHLTATAPTTGYLVEVGQAISTTEFELSQKAPIKL